MILILGYTSESEGSGARHVLAMWVSVSVMDVISAPFQYIKEYIYLK